MTTDTLVKTEGDKVETKVEQKTETKVETKAPEKVETKTEEKVETSDWRKQIAAARAKGDDAAETKLLKRLERFADPGVIFDSLEEAQRTISAAGVKVPGKDASDDEKKAFAKAIGVPEKPDGYGKPVVPEGRELSETDNKALAKIAETFHAKGGFAASPEAIKAAQEAFFTIQEDMQADLIANAATAKLDAEKALRAEWKGEYKANIEFAGAGMVQLIGRENADDFRMLQLADGSLLGDNPLFVKAMAAAGRLAGQDPLLWEASKLGNNPQSLMERKKQIQKLAYGTPDEVKEYNRLSAPGGELETLITKLDALQAKAA